MNQNFQGKVAIVTGASKGIGAAVAKSLAAGGAALVINYASSQTEAEAVVAMIKDAGGRAIAVKGDVSIKLEAQAIVDTAVSEFGRLDVLVNNAGIYSFSALEGVTEEHFHKIFNINVLGLLFMTQAAVGKMHEGGSIINIGASITTMMPPGSSVYSASKSAVETITGVLAKELGAKKIRVNAVNPGPTETEGSARMGGGTGSSLVAQTPLGRFGKPEDIAKAVAFLASEEAGWITGEILVTSGGLR